MIAATSTASTSGTPASRAMRTSRPAPAPRRSAVHTGAIAYWRKANASRKPSARLERNGGQDRFPARLARSLEERHRAPRGVDHLAALLAQHTANDTASTVS